MSFLKGKAIIFNVKDERDGSDEDVNLLEQTLQSMNVTVIKSELSNPIDGNNNILITGIQSFIAAQEYEGFDYAIVAMFSHGLDDEQIVHGDFAISLQKALLNPLFGIESLQNKFKWVIVQACGGQFDCHAAVADSRPRTLGQKYFLKSLACQEGCVAYRAKETGSVFIKTLCENLSNLRESEDVLNILSNTREQIEQRIGLTQLPRDIGNISGRKFYFTTGFVEDIE